MNTQFIHITSQQVLLVAYDARCSPLGLCQCCVVAQYFMGQWNSRADMMLLVYGLLGRSKLEICAGRTRCLIQWQ